MTAAEIIAAASRITNASYDDTTWLSWINSCLDDLSTVAYQPDRKSVALTTSTLEYAIPAGIQEIYGLSYKTAAGAQKALRQLPPTDFYSAGWKLQDKIILQGQTATTGDSLVVHCYKTFANITATTETPSLDAQYHELIVLFLASRSQQKEEELEDKTDFYQEYLNRRNQFAEIRLRQTESWRRTVQNAKK